MFDVDLDRPVLRPDGSQGVIDIGLSNVPPDAQVVDSDILISKILDHRPAEGKHHLVIELKRPSEPVSSEVISQTRSYALAIANGDRYQNVPMNWTFWALSTKMDKFAQFEAQMDGQPKGVVYHSKTDVARNYNMTVWAKAWSEIIEQCTARLLFFQERLNYNATHSSGKQFLVSTYPKFIPKFVHDDNIPGSSEAMMAPITAINESDDGDSKRRRTRKRG